MTWQKKVYGKKEKESGLLREEWKILRAKILERDKFTCLRCGVKFRYQKELSVHHLISRSEGGSNHRSNLVTLCHPCHDIVEIEGYKTSAEIVGSYDEVEVYMPTLAGLDENNAPAPDWHTWVYGGGHNPIR
jgi:5-methylcytosine-specific restriction endonuclease McrA